MLFCIDCAQAANGATFRMISRIGRPCTVSFALGKGKEFGNAYTIPFAGTSVQRLAVTLNQAP